MITTVTANPARDLTYRVARLQIGRSHRVDTLGVRAGGKGMNCAGVLASMSRQHRALAVVGEADRQWWERDAVGRGIEAVTLTAADPHRVRLSTAVVQDDHEVTVLNEQGDAPPTGAWRHLVETALSDAGPGDVIALCGSLPPLAEQAVLAEVVHRGREAGAHVLVDGSGTWLRTALAARPAVVTVNAHEAHEATGIEQPAAAARRLCSLGAAAAVVSDGPRGVVVAVNEHGPVLTAHLSTVLNGNPTGAGDAMTAALCAAVQEHSMPPDLASWTSATRTAVAWSGAAVLAPLAGTVDPQDVDVLLPTVIIKEIA